MSGFSKVAIGTACGRLALLVACLSASLVASAEPVGSALERPSVLTANAASAYLLGIAQAGERLVAVGERGIILLSDDAGISWRQVQAPVSVTLTVVRFADANNGYAVGHGGSVLVTRDGGETWALSLDGQRAARIILAAAQAKGDARGSAEAERLIQDGPDKPLLDVLVLDALNARVIGAYGLALSTADGGKTWTSWLDREVNPGGLHLNAIRSNGERVAIAGEQGLVLLSDDGGASFRALETPYAGSFFTLELPSATEIVVAGLRGNILRSKDGGETWAALQSPVEASITASALQADGQLVFVNQAGLVMKERAGRLLPVNVNPLPPLNNVLPTRQAGLLVLSGQGVSALNPGVKQ
jgi:photosystem II stability/assembly factor-like uncharacterized protein